MSDKTEKATPYKLQKAKEKGVVNKSLELNSTLVLMSLLFVTSALWPSMLQQMKTLMIALFHLSAHFSLQIGNLAKLQQFLLSSLIFLWLPFALASLFSLVLSTIAQTGFVWSTKALSPKMDRINLAQGFKRLVSSHALFMGIKSSLKLIFIFLFILFRLPRETHTLLHLLIVSPNAHPSFIMSLIFKFMWQLLLVLFALAILDKLYMSWKYKKDNRMSKQEVKDEYRQREGDPIIKAKIKQLQQQIRQKTAALEQVKTADVIITNPTHLAIALKYERNAMPAPKVVFKARGDFANQARLLAERHHVPIIQNKSFAQSLFATVDVNQWIHAEHFPVAALIFREIYRQRGLT
ncbi:EscU/YscU/HrcU family type III secretion system export apparatus switch protein [Legionella sp.]|uniref:EscU/YscU/HrcU family type III secretion system export apparatus switch protein n=1 Tax=Legionella sp. TaxID=459 RepID=UPI00321FFBB8